MAVDEVTAEYLHRGDGRSRLELARDCDLIVVLGGDGTLLSAARAVGSRGIPLLAVNLGGLGFMMTTGPEELPQAIENVHRSEFTLDSRMVLEARLEREGAEPERFFALNDIVVANGAFARVLHLEAFADEEFVGAYTADGLIVFTPTGSTAYSLAAGGPVIVPQVPAISLTPICPHTLSNRSVVLPATATVELCFPGGDEERHLSVDGQVSRHLHPQDRIRVFRADHTVDIVHTRSVPYFDVLRSKLRWGDR